MPGDWQLTPTVNHCHCERSVAIQDLGTHTITVQTTMPIIRCEVVQGWESRHYLEKTSVPVLEIEFQQPGTLTTEYRWAV